MKPSKYGDDIKQLVKIANGQENKINLSTIMITLKTQGCEMQEILDYLEDEGIEIINSDIEPDATDESEKIRPFDPSKIDIKMEKFSLDSLIKRLKFKEIELDSDFQRKSGLWSNIQKSQLIESILLKIPLPAFYFDATNEDNWIIIDGLQRVTTLKEFVIEQSLILDGMEFLKDLNNLTFNEIPRNLQRRLEETNINAYLVNPNTPVNVKYNIFKRINTGGLQLVPQEIRNALYQGAATKFLKELAQLPIFSKVFSNSIRDDRMLDREFCLRFVAFSFYGTENYFGSIEDFLNDTMLYLNKTTKEERTKIKKCFILALERCQSLLGIHSFRKMASDGRRRPINKAIFESWTNVVLNLSESQYNNILHRANRLKEEYISLCESDYYLIILKNSDKKSVINRIQAIEDIINKTLGG